MDAIAIGTAITIINGVLTIGSKVIDFKKYFRKEGKPELILDPERPTRPVTINVFVEHKSPKGINQGHGYNIPYEVPRFYIKNVGQIGAEDCRGYLIKDGDQEMVSWNYSENRASVAIHAGGRVELELCAALSFDANWFNKYNKTTFDESEIGNLYHRLNTPRYIAPTERGFESPMPRNRIITTGRYEALVTSITPKTKPLRIPIEIS